MTRRLGQFFAIVFAFAVVVPSLYAQGGIAAQITLARLKAGNVRFVDGKLAPRELDAKKRELLVKGQRPTAIVIACSDSRVVPEYIFDQGLGEIFVARVPGNIAGPDIIAAAEYAVKAFPSVALVVVMAHEDCGAVKAALGDEPIQGDLGWLIKQIDPGKELPKDPKEALAAAAKNNAVRQGQLLTERSAVVKEFVQGGRIQIVPAYYHLASGKVEWLDTVKLTGKHPVFITVTVPSEDARVWLDEAETKSRGLKRIFEVPPVEANEEFSYVIRARWSVDGIPVEREKKVTFKGGMKISVDFK